MLRSDAGSRGMGSAARASGPSDTWTGSEVCSGTPGPVSVSPRTTGTPLASHFFSPAEGKMLAARKRGDPCQPSAVRKAAALPWTLVTGQRGEGPPAQFSRGPACTWGPREREGPEARRTSGQTRAGGAGGGTSAPAGLGDGRSARQGVPPPRPQGHRPLCPQPHPWQFSASDLSSGSSCSVRRPRGGPGSRRSFPPQTSVFASA